ncbi:pyridoxamine 5'-phosphate oxidase family protein [Anabaena sp. FACHB-1237]|uniref:Npun_F5749 family FMN-dependent PPOX-type flavoprotein n=1 Tax=Anabaena sp. FACHB-1237 TaxID=2692769 RepID=UPI001681544F|nr:Npun_F5749 family FMN-dependent PPOX-type flavoprotein [Anabaena sp. FACHB-1237]MBD2136694.1 pyridoxamine 5'-phosphate oxidase family protein [Anabaena sp. FACHB-1237]
MSLAPWRAVISRALHKNSSLVYSRYVQLATVREDGLPANRTVVFRGFLEDTDVLRFITDIRSAKAEQIQKQGHGEVCWYFPKTREQFRIAGRLILVSANSHENLQAARIKMWQELSNAARVQFIWPQPGDVRVRTPEAFTQLVTSSIEPVENFCLLLLEPTLVDHLELRGEPQNRSIYQIDETQSWYYQEVNP